MRKFVVRLFLGSLISSAPLSSQPNRYSASEVSVLVYNTHLFDLPGHTFGKNWMWSSNFDDGFWEGFAHFCSGLFTDERLMLKDNQRAERMVKAIANIQDGGPDIIILTEVWSDTLAQKFVNSLGHHHYRPPSDNYFLLHSGMLLLSRHPIREGSEFFIPFQKLSGVDASTSKGIGIVTIEDPTHGPTGVIFAHAQADYEEADYDIIRENLSQILRVVDNYVEENPDNPLIVAGDFNMPDNHAHYHYLSGHMARHGLKDAFIQATTPNLPEASYTYDSTKNRLLPLLTFSGDAPDKRQRIDYIFHHPVRHGNVTHMPLPSALAKLFMWDHPDHEKPLDLSDHWPLYLKLARKPAG